MNVEPERDMGMLELEKGGMGTLGGGIRSGPRGYDEGLSKVGN